MLKLPLEKKWVEIKSLKPRKSIKHQKAPKHPKPGKHRKGKKHSKHQLDPKISNIGESTKSRKIAKPHQLQNDKKCPP